MLRRVLRLGHQHQHAVDGGQAAGFGLLQKSLSLLKSRTGSGSEDTRQHYRLLIHQIEQKLK